MHGNKPQAFAERLREAYSGKTVLVTGHTGFKGAWLSEWLLKLGARVVGIGLVPQTDPALFDQLGLATRLEHHLQDIRDRDALSKLILNAEPDYLFHLAAEPLVRASYVTPVLTYDVNVMGTVYVLDTLRELQRRYRQSSRACSAVLITTDKVYLNREWLYSYREEDALGGYDPYSSSKACAEIAIASFRQSFFDTRQQDVRVGVASARAGNVIGAGDWAADRIVPDCVRALRRGEPIQVRNPRATRPWQHVLEPLAGYLRLGMYQYGALSERRPDTLALYASPFNFGPDPHSVRPVSDLVTEVLRHVTGRWESSEDEQAPHEAGKLGLTSEKAHHLLDWRPRWNFAETVKQTILGYAALDDDASKGVDDTINSFLHDSV